MNIGRMLSNLAPCRVPGTGQRKQMARQRFARLVSSPDGTAGPDTPNAPRDNAAGAPSITLTVDSGLHRGASIELTAAEYLLGSDTECDIVLRDPGVESGHCRLLRQSRGFHFRDLRTAMPMPPQSVRREGARIVSSHDVGGVQLTLTRSVPECSSSQTSAARLFSGALVAGLVLTACAFFAAHHSVEHRPADVAAQLVNGNAALSAAGFDTVRLRRNANGDLQIAGLVANAAERQRLHEWLESGDYGSVRLVLRQASELQRQVRETLSDETLDITFVNGGLRIQGTTHDLVVKDRLRLLTDELKGVVEVDDRVAYSEAQRSPGPLPVRIRDVMIGSPGYFRTNTGGRYYEGAVLPDGAEVLAIEPSEIRFRLDGKIVAYNLE